MTRSLLLAQESGKEAEGLVKGFKNHGYDVLYASDGQEAKDLLANNKPPAVILLSSSLSGINAVELCRQIRQKGKFSRTPILILQDSENVPRKEFVALKVSAIVQRPFSSYQLHQTISNLPFLSRELKVGKIDFNKQVTGVTVAITIFIAVVVYFVLIPMFLSAKSEKKGTKSFKDSIKDYSESR